MNALMKTFVGARAYEVFERVDGPAFPGIYFGVEVHGPFVTLDSGIRQLDEFPYPVQVRASGPLYPSVLSSTVGAVSPIFPVSSSDPVLNKSYASVLRGKSERSYYGSKLIIFVPQARALAFYREENKPLDFVGGQRENGESPYQCLEREVFEETKCDLTTRTIHCIGESSAFEESEVEIVKATSMVYLTVVAMIDPVIRDMEMVLIDEIERMDPSRYQEWVFRILSFLKKQFGAYENLYWLDHSSSEDHKRLTSRVGPWLESFFDTSSNMITETMVTFRKVSEQNKKDSQDKNKKKRGRPRKKYRDKKD